jgi:hypothetical protein
MEKSGGGGLLSNTHILDHSVKLSRSNIYDSSSEYNHIHFVILEKYTDSSYEFQKIVSIRMTEIEF